MKSIPAPPIPVSEPLLGGSAAAYVTECIETGWVSSQGRFIGEFEDAWARYCDGKVGVAVNSGTAALEIAVAALELEPGSEIILPSYTIISCALAVIAAGCTPVLVDCEPDTWCMDVDAVADKITSRTRALMPVHIFGHPVDMDPLLALADKHGLGVIEDAAEAHGAEYKGRRVGALGDLGCFSFYANKIVTTGEGGMVVARSDKYAERLRYLRNMCFSTDRRFRHTELGRNFRMTNVMAAIGLSQVEAVDSHIEKKRWMGAAYGERLSFESRIALPVERDWAKNVYWMYGIVLGDDVRSDAEAFSRLLAAQGIDTRPFFLGMHEQPVLKDRGLFSGESYAVTERIARRGLYLPSGLTLDEDQLDRVCDVVRTVLADL